MGRKMLDKMPEKNMVGLCFFENGFRHVTNSRRPINKAEDLKGLKIRTVQNPVYIDVFNTLGANATPMPFPEVFGALESRVIDAQETPYGNIHGGKFYEVQKYMTTTGHIYNAAVLTLSRKVWDQMTPAEHKVLQDGCASAQEFQRRHNRETDPKLHADLRAKGLAINELPAAERARMREMLKPVYDKYSRTLGEDLVRQTVAELDKNRGKAK
jgi:tripartite ATP-independent transporter DctP family solute receptor